MGIPTAPMVTRAFRELVTLNAAKRGMPRVRTVFTPHPVWGKSAEELRAYVDGPDPVTGKPLMQEAVEALTLPLNEEEKKTGEVTVSVGPATFGPDTADNLQEHYLNNGMTDYLPIILPTEEKVEAMLKGTRHKPDEIVGKMAAGAYPPWQYTVRQVAVNAVMAGARPEYFPTILAIASSGWASIFSSTNSFAFAAVINGPIRDKLEMNYGIGALGPLAQPASPWAPLHVQKGFKAEENVVSLFRGLGIVPGQGARGTGVNENPRYEEQFSDLFSVFTGFFGALVIPDPLIAQSLKERGYDTKEKLAEWLHKNTTQTVKDYKNRNFSYLFEYPRALRGEEPYATWYKLPDDAVIPRWPKADHINIVVAGGQTNAYFQAATMSYGTSISIDKWA
ncbi:MAG: hypothetical protein LAN59_10420 [Acidobacteriia bacterium]|nr:hypothetical protein [Terriglobia bacterium]